MKLIDTEIYNDIKIDINYNNETKCFSAYSNIASSHNSYKEELKNFCGGFKTPLEAIDDVKLKIDEFLNQSPKTYTELAEMITNSLVWTGYEECHADEQIIKQLVSSFIKTQKL